jgi:glycine cleavage system aminomethyltransferase T
MDDIYDEGWNARYNDRAREDNPYPLNTFGYSAWDMGWYEADYCYYSDDIDDEVGFTAPEPW